MPRGVKYLTEEERVSARKAANKRSRSRNKESWNDYMKKWRGSNKEQLNAYQRRRHPEVYQKERERMALDMEFRAKTLLHSVRSNARKRGIPYDISWTDIVPLLKQGICAVSGLTLDFAVARGNPRGPSIDRIDSSKGYVPGNVQVVCLQANMAKGKWDYDSLLEFCKGVTQCSRLK